MNPLKNPSGNSVVMNCALPSSPRLWFITTAVKFSAAMSGATVWMPPRTGRSSQPVPPFSPHAEWAESLADSLLTPEFPISMLEAIGRRLRRNYMFIYLILGLAWMMKIYLHPFPAATWEEFISRAALGSISGQSVFMAGIIFTGFMALLALFTIRLNQTSGEVLPKFDFADLEGDTTPLSKRFPISIFHPGI